MAYRISLPVPVLFGERASLQSGQKLQEMGVSKVMCVYDQGVKAVGLVEPILQNIKAQGIGVVEYDQVLPDPPDYTVNQGGELGREEQVEAVLGLGGGSAMDTAKGINLLLGNPLPITNYLNPGVPTAPGKKLVLIPTTAGTGSEVTNIAVITNTTTHLKAGFTGPAATADLAIVDPTLMTALPPQITAATGMDAFAHALEAFTSVQKNPLADVLAHKAMEIVVQYLPRAVKDGSAPAARTQLAFAATIAGYAFSNAMVHMGHAIAHSLGAFAHIPHGVGCALALPQVVRFLAEHQPDSIREVGQIMGLELPLSLTPREAGEAVAQRISAFNQEIRIPSLRDLNVTAAQIPAITKLVMADSCMMFMPRRAGSSDIAQALENTLTE